MSATNTSVTGTITVVTHDDPKTIHVCEVVEEHDFTNLSILGFVAAGGAASQMRKALTAALQVYSIPVSNEQAEWTEETLREAEEALKF